VRTQPSEGTGVPTVTLLGVAVSVESADGTAGRIVREAAGHNPTDGLRYVCATSVHGLVEASRDPDFRRILNEAWIITPDGMPLVWLGRRLGARAMERVYGPTLMLRVCELSAPLGLRHFFYGGAPGVADDLARRLTTRFPGLVSVGTHCPPFRPLTRQEMDDATRVINESGADIVWVGLGTPRQERWADAARGRLEAKVAVTVGAAFDFHTERVRQAPRWMQRRGLEWLFRITQEPGRLLRRYASNNPRFVYLAARQLFAAGPKTLSH
jgi:N-acetylglucosaminyldiphosphoundecaprenol N-acetyl-beta-D-mannosaminyltransferase